jgi:hypothetical protein
MTHASYGAASRRPVYSGNRRVPGLYQRTLANGTVVYDVALRLGGKGRRHRLEARTKTDAIAELRALQVDDGCLGGGQPLAHHLERAPRHSRIRPLLRRSPLTAFYPAR